HIDGARDDAVAAAVLDGNAALGFGGLAEAGNEDGAQRGGGEALRGRDAGGNRGWGHGRLRKRETMRGIGAGSGAWRRTPCPAEFNANVRFRGRESSKAPRKSLYPAADS